jgi:hypothetical protein
MITEPLELPERLRQVQLEQLEQLRREQQEQLLPVLLVQRLLQLEHWRRVHLEQILSRRPVVWCLG